ncbi:Uu.00g063230.m01.CDS01 [Anthostomella pinea]|uniref:Uu.00g063230.m01.CDS01 n=1 Tax=Anthostomella pinea TaxID=933095 RepID=A0AAI8YMY5_9PEZI|nr:Uu.00g063230.m01.CDS01 [Anthostomella pinea]
MSTTTRLNTALGVRRKIARADHGPSRSHQTSDIPDLTPSSPTLAETGGILTESHLHRQRVVTTSPAPAAHPNGVVSDLMYHWADATSPCIRGPTSNQAHGADSQPQAGPVSDGLCRAIEQATDASVARNSRGGNV